MKNRAKQDKAVSDLLGYATDFGAFLNSACPSLPGNPAACAGIRSAAAHMRMIADPLAAAIARQFPDRFAAR